MQRKLNSFFALKLLDTSDENVFNLRNHPVISSVKGNQRKGLNRSSPSELFLEKGVLKICNKFTGEQLCCSVISIKLLSTLLKSYFGMGVNLLHIFRTPFPKNTSGGLPLSKNVTSDLKKTS